MRYFVDIKDTSYATITVEADSLEEAEEKAQEAYYNGMVEWRDCDRDIEARIMEKDRGEER